MSLLVSIVNGFTLTCSCYHVMVEELTEDVKQATGWTSDMVNSSRIRNLMNISVSSLPENGMEVTIGTGTSNAMHPLLDGHQYRFALAASLLNGTNYYLPSSRSVISKWLPCVALFLH